MHFSDCRLRVTFQEVISEHIVFVSCYHSLSRVGIVAIFRTSGLVHALEARR
jgi:hypothetical protein